MNIRSIVIRTLTTGFIGLVVAGARAQDTPFAKQEKARLEFAQLTEAMQRLQVTLADSAPDESSVLKRGNKFIQSRSLRSRMDEARNMLRRAQWDEAMEQMAAVRKDLATLMDLLLNRDLDLEDLLKEIARLEEFKKRVEELIDEQQAEKENAARAEALQQHLRELELAKAQLEQLIGEQQDVRDRANESGLSAAAADAAEMAEHEGRLEADTEDLAKRAEELEKEHKALEAGRPDSGGAKNGEPKAAAAGSCSGSCKSAAGSMGSAQKKLGANQPERSLEDMDKALRDLKKAASAVAEMAEEARRELLALPLEQQARAQQVTQVKTDKLAEEMEESADDADGEGKKPAPGTQNVQQAVPKQKAAAGQLKEYKPSKAKQDQQDAVANLEEAKQKLEDALAQLRQQLQDEVLRALEERFGAMLAKQKELSARTIVTDRLAGESLASDGQLPAAIVARCADLADGERQLAAEADDALNLLQEDATTAVFPEIVIDVRDDLERVASRLGDNKTAAVSQGIQAEIEDTLRMLLDALRRTIEENEGGRCGQCNGQPPLVPLSAEVKLILAMQKRVAMRTKAYDGATPQAERESQQAVDQAEEIARKQGRVHSLTRKLAHKQNKEDPAGNR